LSAPLIVIPGRYPKSERCPTCGAGKESRTSVQTFGMAEPVPMCGACGHEFKDEEAE
jgi:transcription elongation factor Elf1